MRIHQILTLAIIAGTALPVNAQVPWDMVPTETVAPEMQEAKYQSPINPAALGGYSLAAPQNSGSLYGAGGLGGAQQALNSGGALGSLGNRAINGYGYTPTQTGNRSHSQNLGLPHAGTMGLAPVFGTGNDGFTSPGGYTPPMINIPGVGSYRIPQTLGLPGGVGSIQLPTLDP